MNRDSAAEIETIIRPDGRAELSIVVGTVVPMAFKKRYKSRSRTQNQVLPVPPGGRRKKKIGQREERGSRGTRRRGKTLIILRQTHRGCAHRYICAMSSTTRSEREKIRWYIIGKEDKDEREESHRFRTPRPSSRSLAKTAPLWRLWKWNCNRKRGFTAQEIHPPPPPPPPSGYLPPEPWAASFATWTWLPRASLYFIFISLYRTDLHSVSNDTFDLSPCILQWDAARMIFR